MPSFVMVNGLVFINGVDLSDQCEAMTVTPSKEIKDFTTFGASANKGRNRKSGLYDWRIRFDFFSNYDAAKVDATLFPLLGVQTAIRARADATAAISATNPEYQGNGMFGEMAVLQGTVGEPAKQSIEFQMSDGIALIRDITP